jgi:hypothetical protein
VVGERALRQVLHEIAGLMIGKHPGEQGLPFLRQAVPEPDDQLELVEVG